MRDAIFARAIRMLEAGDAPPDGTTVLQVETTVPTPCDRAFAFFAEAGNLEALTPPWLNFKIRTPRPIAMHEGTVIDYEISLYGLPLPWRTRIDVWQPGVCFVDRQIAGPYLWWRHEHLFEPTPFGTRIIDRVDYVPRVRFLSSRLVTRDVSRIFAFRQHALQSLLPGQTNTPCAPSPATS